MRWKLAAVLSCLVLSPALAQEPEPTQEQVDAAVQAKEWERADALSRTLTERQPKDPGAWLRRGLALHGRGEYAQAIEALQRAGKLGAPPVMVALRQARAYARMKQLDAAFQQLDAAITKGFGMTQLLQTDPDLEPLRGDARFEQVVARVERNAHPCAYQPEMRQFDFWEGEWDVTVSGTSVGSSRVERILDGCVLLENWSSPGSSGKSFNLYDTGTKRWRQTWVDQRGRITDYVGGREGNLMRFLARTTLPSGKKGQLRMTFTPLGADQVRQLIEQSEDGKTWSVSFDGLYTRRKSEH